MSIIIIIFFCLFAAKVQLETRGIVKTNLSFLLLSKKE